MKKLTILGAIITIATLSFAGLENPPSFSERLLHTATTPANGTNAVQTLTTGGTPTGGTFKLSYEGNITASITWSATDATFATNIQTALNAIGHIGTSGVAVTVGTGTSGIGTYLITFSGANLARRPVTLIAVNTSALTGTSPTVAVTSTTAGVTADGRFKPKGTLCVADDTGILYQNTGSPPNPTWVKVSSE